VPAANNGRSEQALQRRGELKITVICEEDSYVIDEYRMLHERKYNCRMCYTVDTSRTRYTELKQEKEKT